VQPCLRAAPPAPCTWRVVAAGMRRMSERRSARAAALAARSRAVVPVQRWPFV